MEATIYRRTSREHRCKRCDGLMRAPLTRIEMTTHVRRALDALTLAEPEPRRDEDPLAFCTRRARELYERITFDAVPSLATIDSCQRLLCGSCYAGGAR